MYANSLESKFKFYLNEIPENVTDSILPFLRWEYSYGDYKSYTISSSIKITRWSKSSLLVNRIISSLKNALSKYSLRGKDIDLFLMGRPWLSADEFSVKLPVITDVLDKQIEK